MAQITYTNKETLNSQPSIADKNKVTSSDMNEIKSVVNTNYGEVGDITNLNTTDKSSVVNAINELKGGEIYSTSEVKTNKIWIDNKPIYRAYINFAHTSTGTYTYTHNLGIDEIVSVDAYCSVSGQSISNNGYRIMPVVNVSNSYMFTIDTIKENTITTNAVGWQNNHAYIWLEYTKTS